MTSEGKNSIFKALSINKLWFGNMTVKQCHLHVTTISNSAKIEQSMNKSKKLLTELNSILGLGSFWKQKKNPIVFTESYTVLHDYHKNASK